MARSEKWRRVNLEALGGALILLDLIIFRTWILAAVVFSLFLVDFLRYRREARLNWEASRSLRESMTLADIRAIERKYSLRQDFKDFEKHAEARPPLERHFYYAKYERVRELFLTHGPREGLWLDLGCGFGEDLLFLAEHLPGRVVGLELDEIKLFEGRRKFGHLEAFRRASLCAGDVMEPPFRARSFEGILMTEVLEHLTEPEKGLEACRKLLREGGVLIVSTPSLHNLDYTLNPFRLLEKTISLLDDRILPPYHHLHARFEYSRKNPEPEYGIHYHFSQRKLRDMAAGHGFEVVFEGSFEIELPPWLYLERLLAGDIARLQKIIRPVECFLERLPLLNHLGQHLLLVARRKG